MSFFGNLLNFPVITHLVHLANIKSQFSDIAVPNLITAYHFSTANHTIDRTCRQLCTKTLIL
ncbi:Uncharacterised protein [Vibrio cholerae]|nr:Uncharacterised protein [Vibrio cholerae]CSB36040.1 Uncharacterised protein [Vibrio cholerae]